MLRSHGNPCIYSGVPTLMPRLSDRLENALNEGRMLLLGGQVLLGFTYRIIFEDAFEKLPRPPQLAEVTALAVMTIGLSWLLWPVAFHRIAEHGWPTERMHAFVTRVLDFALVFFCLGIGLSFYPVDVALRLSHPAWIALAAGVLATGVWYAGAAAHRHGSWKTARQVRELEAEEKNQHGDLSERIKKVLIECRMALPGAQAFLGFQFSIVFMQGFEKLPRSSQLAHFASLVAMTVSIVLLIAPAAYHRLAEGGEESEHFHRVASNLLLAGLVFLAPGMACDLYVVLRKVTGSFALSLDLSAGLLAVSYALWFGWSWAKRRG